MSFEKTPATNDYWAAFTSATGKVADGYVVVAFGHTKGMADELVALVLAGTKRATTSLLLEYAPGVESMPRVGDFVVVVDGEGNPRCIWCTTEIIVKPLIEVDDTFAWDEGEGDRTRDWWLSAHREYFTAQAQREGFTMHDEIEIVFERFEIVWPSEGADLVLPRTITAHR